MTSLVPAGRISGHAISAARPVDANDYARWARGYLRFQGEPLTRVVAEVNRYSPRRIRLLDPELGRRLFTACCMSATIRACSAS